MYKNLHKKYDTLENDEYGEWLYRSEDGGKTWTSIYPGKLGDYIWNPDTGECKPTQLYDFLDDGGYDWVYGKAIHWSGSLVLNPNNPEQVIVSSGNGVFQWNDIWGDSPEAVFHPDGIEEVVCLDFVNTLYMWGMPSENDKEGIYRSQDGGKTWDELNTDKHFGGTGNGNFIVGDMSKFRTVYMSTVGMGIVYGQFTGSSAEYETGDINGDGIINAADVLLLKKYILGEKLSASQSKRADMNNNGSVDVTDEVILINKILK